MRRRYKLNFGLRLFRFSWLGRDIRVCVYILVLNWSYYDWLPAVPVLKPRLNYHEEPCDESGRSQKKKYRHDTDDQGNL